MRNKRGILAGIIAVVACGFALLTLAKSSEDVSCGLGPPPDADAFGAFEAAAASQVQRLGYTKVCAGNLERYQIDGELRPMTEVVPELQFRPVELANTPFHSFTNLGALAESVSKVNSRLYRSFKMPDGHTVTLFEHDMSADGTHSYRDPKDEPERVNDAPARLVVLQVPEGKAVSVLSWKEARRGYELWIDANVVLEKKQPQFFALAATLPKSIPARTQEPEAEPVMLGPGGLPLIPPPPAFPPMGK